MELSASFLRMVAVQRASFGATLPFSVLAFTDEIHCFYANTDPSCRWRAVRRQSRAWAKRDQKLVEHNCGPECMKDTHRYDLSADAPLVIITDGIDAKHDKACVRGPAARLLTALGCLHAMTPSFKCSHGLRERGSVPELAPQWDGRFSS